MGGDLFEKGDGEGTTIGEVSRLKTFRSPSTAPINSPSHLSAPGSTKVIEAVLKAHTSCSKSRILDKSILSDSRIADSISQ